MQSKNTRLGLIFVAVLGVGIVGYALIKKGSTQSSPSGTTGPFTTTSWDPTGGISVSNIGGSAANGGLIGAGNVGNPITGTTPIGIDPWSGEVVNTVESKWANEPIQVNPSSWQGTTNKSGSLTYLQGELAGEGSSIAKLQGVTY